MHQRRLDLYLGTTGKDEMIRSKKLIRIFDLASSVMVITVNYVVVSR
jgi:hypothetical protein